MGIGYGTLKREMSGETVLPFPTVILWPLWASLDHNELQVYHFVLHLAPKLKPYLDADLETVIYSLPGGKEAVM